MCYGAESTPPDHGLRGAVLSEEDLVLTAPDGARFTARLARAGDGTGTGIVILPDVRGLHRFYCALTRSFAEAGVDAISFDYFGRTAGLTEGREEEFDYKPHVEKLNFEQISGDVATAAAHLRSDAGVERVFTIGFCMGASNSWRQSAAVEGIAGSIGLYGRPSLVKDVVARLRAPLLLLAAGADFTPVEEVEQFSTELTQAGIDNRLVVFEGAPHSFFDRTFAQHQAACATAWREILDFLDVPAREAALD